MSRGARDEKFAAPSLEDEGLRVDETASPPMGEKGWQGGLESIVIARVMGGPECHDESPSHRN